MTTDVEHAAVFREMLDRLTFEGESLPVKAAIERAIDLLDPYNVPLRTAKVDAGDPVHVLPHGSVREAPEALR